MNVADLRTPCALVDLDRVERNTARMAERMAKLGVRLRPHVKTHKTVEGARLQTRGHFGGITVSTPAEARFFGAAGFRDVTYAFPAPIGRLDEIDEISRSVDRFNLLVDHESTADALDRRGRYSVFLKVDCGDHRAGVDPERAESVRLAARLAERHDLRGILTHAGHSYASANAAEILDVARRERDVMARFASKLRESGVPVDEVSVGSTPTMSRADDLRGVTEARPGNYVFYDVFQATIGSCALQDVALSVLASVAGHYPEQNKMIVDAGALALSKDGGPRHVDPDCGHGVVCTLDGAPLRHLKLRDISQEHGQMYGTEPIKFARFPIGSKLRILPNHSCLAAAMHDPYHVHRGSEVVARWRPCKGW